jgi:cell division septal protein FtsQ
VLKRLVYENTAFAIEEIDAQTDGVITPDQLRQWSGVRVGDNLLALDLARVSRDLKLVSAIQSVSLERILPHTLKIRVAEREPLAQVNPVRQAARGGLESAVFYLDAEGYVIMPLEPRQRTAPLNADAEQLPVIFGPTASQVQVGHRIESPPVLAALQLLAAFDNSPMAGLVDIKRVDASAPDVLTVFTGQGSEVIFGLEDMDQQLRRWRAIFDEGQRLSKAVASLDLAVTTSIPVRWLEGSAVPPSTPKLPKKKKNV